VKGNYIGPDATGNGSIVNSNGTSGVEITSSASNNTIGSSTAGEGNVISSNFVQGITIDTGATGNTVKGNYIGLKADGSGALSNGARGVWINGAASNTIGGTTSAERNVISGNWIGIVIGNSGANSNMAYGNYIGTNPAGTGGVPNTQGILLQSGVQNNVIGGTAAGQSNVIAYNTGEGVYLDSTGTTDNKISGNAIYSNLSLGIDIAPTGVGTGSGANNNKARPTITVLTANGVNYDITVTCTSGDTIEFFRVNNAAAPAVSPDPSGSGEGYLYLGKCIDNGACSGPYVSGATDANVGAGTVKITLTASGVTGGDYVTASATDATNGTSEFAANVQALVTYTISGTVYTDDTASATVGAGKTVRLLKDGASEGTAVTAAGGTYSITPATLAASDAIMVYIEGDATYKGSAVTISNGASLANLNIYGDHSIITRFDNGAGSLNNANMSTALGGYSNAGIEWSVPAGVLTCNAGTILNIPSGYTFAPGANTSLDSIKILGTFTGGSYSHNVTLDFIQSATTSTVNAGTSTITVGRSFTADGTVSETGFNSATLILTGTGGLNYTNLLTYWFNGFNNLTVGQSGNTTTL
jgi:hypothetical protein